MSHAGTADFNYQMGYTEAEFEKTLKSGFTAEASPYHSVDVAKNQWRISHNEDALDMLITISQSPDRKIGALSLPVLQVNFTATDTGQASVDAFFDKFFKYFHKGGG